MSKKYLLINPPVYDRALFSRFDQPSGLLRIGKYLLNQGHRVRLIDFLENLNSESRLSFCNPNLILPEEISGLSPIKIKKFKRGKEAFKVAIYHFGVPFSEFKQKLKEEKPDHIYITSGMTYHYQAVFDTIAICKKIYPNVPVTLGGIYATLCPDHAKKSRADEIFVGELLEANELPPAVELLPKIPNLLILKSVRGCPNRCSYCAVSVLEGCVPRHVAPLKIFDQMKYFRQKYGIRNFGFWDANVLLNSRNHFEKILDLIIENKLDVSIDLHYGIAANQIYERLVNKMKKARVQNYFNLSLESAEEYVFKDRFHRTSTLEDLKNAIKILRAHNFTNLKLHVLGGMPGQTMESVLKSLVISWSYRVIPAILFFSPIPRTEEYLNHYDKIREFDLEDLNPNFFPFAGEPVPLSDWLLMANFSGKNLDEAKKILKGLSPKNKIRKCMENYISEIHNL